VHSQCIFEPKVIEFDRKRLGMDSPHHPDVTEEIIELSGDHVVSRSLMSASLNSPRLHRLLP
jgi:actin-related protein 8